MIDKRQKVYQAFGEFLIGFMIDLNHRSEEGWTLLVEGRRDVRALRNLGYGGHIVTVSRIGRKGPGAFGKTKGVIVLTDLDREGAVLASRFIKRLGHEGLRTSLRERRRLKAASHGVFLHIENLSRFEADEF